MAKKRRSLKGCKRVKYKATTRVVCRDAKGRIRSSAKAGKSKKRRKGCPAQWKGHRVVRTRKGGCVAKLPGNRRRFVKKLRGGGKTWLTPRPASR